MEISFDEHKRLRSLEERGLDFEDASHVFDGTEYTVEDDRHAYPERRFQTMGRLNNRLVMVVWTPVDIGIRVISMRKCNEREQARYISRMG